MKRNLHMNFVTLCNPRLADSIDGLATPPSLIT